MKSKKIVTVAVVIIVAILIVFLLLRSCSNGQTSTTPKPSSEQKTLDFTPYDYTGDKISIPAVTGINFKAGQLEQTVEFCNPDQNDCYFKLSLYLSDDTLIWQSDLIRPSERVTEITLNQTLKRGLYRNCRLVYDCFGLDDQKPLNSADVQLEINAH